MQYNIVEIVGYLASLIVAISLLMKSIYKLRVYNLIGSFVFSIYGLLINSIPVFLLNLFICFINIYFLYRIMNKKEYFTLFEVDINSDYLNKFIQFYYEDIKNYYNSFDLERIKTELTSEKIYFYFILRDLLPAGLFILKKLKDEEYFILIDYVVPQYRDFKISKFLFNKNKDYFIKKGINILITNTNNKKHQKYLIKMGFKKCFFKDDNNQSYFIKYL